MKSLKYKLHLIISFILMVVTHPVLANRLEEAATRGQGIVISIGQTTSVIGIILGGIALSLGMGGAGRMVLVSGIIGAVATFGGPALVAVIKDIFR